MTTYKQMKHALLSNNTIEMYKPTARLIEMVTILACHGIVSIVTNGTDWRVTLIRKPTVNPNLTVADLNLKTKSALVLITPVTVNSLVGQKVHLWNDYPTGKKPTMGKWEVKEHHVRKRPFFGHTWKSDFIHVSELVTLEYKPTQKTITRIRTSVCTATEYEAYIANLNTKIAKVAA